jgi:hypothetical protein
MDGEHEGFKSTVAEIQAMTGLSRPTFRTAIQTLETYGLLQRRESYAENGATNGIRYILLEPHQVGGNTISRGESSRQRYFPPNAHGRIEEEVKKGATPQTPLAKEQAVRGGVEKLRYGSKVSTKLQTKIAVGLLDSWNSETGQRIKVFDGLGRTTAGMKLILGAVMAHPDVEASYWLRTMNTVLASPYPYWGKSPSPGVVFGPKVVDANLQDPTRNAGKPPINASTITNSNLTPEQRRERRRREIEQLERVDTG